MTEFQYDDYADLVEHAKTGMKLENDVAEFKAQINMDTHKNWIHLYRQVNETQREIQKGWEMFKELVDGCVERRKKMIELKNEISKLAAMIGLYDDDCDEEIASRLDFFEIAMELRDPKLDELAPEERIYTEARLLDRAGFFSTNYTPHEEAMMTYVLSLGIPDPEKAIYLD